MEFTCKRCGYCTGNKSNIIRHLRSKIPCDATNEDIPQTTLIKQLQQREFKSPRAECSMCNKMVSNSQLSRHKKLCKAKALRIKESEIKQEIGHMKHSDLDEFKQVTTDMLKKQQLEIECLKQQISCVLIEIQQTKTMQTVQISPSTSKPCNKKKMITQAVRIVCWNTYIGEEVGKTLCLCCKSNNITQHNFHCGHVIAEAEGGTIHVNNLRPICAVCNNSMGTTNMILFAKDNFDVDI
jgi:hypothetical protein